MNKQKLAIVSSYDELCGNASYTKALENELKNHFDVTVIPLEVDLLRKGDKKRSNLHIQHICKKLQEFDCVNIQLEAGLFGSRIPSIKKNFFAIANAAKKLVITMHRYQSYDRYPSFVSLAKHLLRGSIKGFIKEFRVVLSNNRYVPFYHSVINFCKKNEIPIIVHTKRDKKSIVLDFDFDQVFDHPLCFYRQQDIQKVKDQSSKKEFYKSLGLSQEKKYIGIFGFINHYKSHETAIKSLVYLPDEYELLICGAQHPHSIQIDETINPYIKELLKIIDTLTLSKRVHFHRLSSDEEFLTVLTYCDYNVLPYLEVLQGGSAIAALSLETNSKAIFSQNLAFFELEKYAQNSFKMFSIGNYMELATAILNYDSSKYEKSLINYHQKYNILTSAHLYRDLLCRSSLNDTLENPIKNIENMGDSFIQGKVARSPNMH